MPTNNQDKLAQTTEPNIGELRSDFNRSYSDERFTNRIRQSDETRFATWDGQTDDGKKHAKDLKAPAFPWEGASDTRIRLADELCKFQVNLFNSAVTRAALNVSGTESRDDESAAAIGLYLRWMLNVLLQPDWEDELELHSEYAAQYGWSVLHIAWERCNAQVPRKITLQSLAGHCGVQDPQTFDRLAAQLSDPTKHEMMADLFLASNEGLTRAKVLKHIKELAKTGETTFEMPEEVKNLPRIVALRPYHDVLFPPETEDWQRARVIFRRDYYTVTELDQKAASGEWDKTFVEEVKKTAGQHSQVWDYALSPVIGDTERIEDHQNMVEVVHAYSRRTTDSGNPGIYLTVFSPYMGENGTNKELYGRHELVTEQGETYPFEVFRLERTRRSPIESRGIAELVRTWQNEYKAQADMVFDRSSFDTLPPIKVPLRYGQRLKIGPGSQLSEQRPGDISWMDSPKRGTELSFELMKQITYRADRYFGRFNEEIPPAETQLTQQANVTKWLRHMSCVITRIWNLVQQFDDDERFAKVTGTGLPIPRDPGQHNFELKFDVRELDSEFVEKKLQAISNFVLPEDNMGIVDRTKLIRKKLQVIDPTLPNELVVETAEASQAMFKETNNQVALMSLGNQPEFLENDPSANIRLQFMMQIIQSNPKYQQQLQSDQQFQELVQAYAQNLQMSVMQQQNKQVGRLGVNPNA